tara:strand:- start:1459 stop:2286 length:828 start_codon:yes stop_codon:yes gene_type:complete
MTLPASGQISLNQVNVELGYSGTAQIAMAGGPVRTLFGVPSGEIGMDDGYGKSNWSPSGTLISQNFTGNASTTGTAISAQAGDIVIAANGALTTGTTTLAPGFTVIHSYTATVQWNTGSPTYKSRGCLQYKILTGNETHIVHNVSSSQTVFQQYRFANPISSVSVAQQNPAGTSSNGAYGNAAYTHSARTSQPEGVLRVVCFIGYGAASLNSSPGFGISNIDTGFSVNDTTTLGSQYSRMLSASSFGSTYMYSDVNASMQNAFRGLGVAATLVLT